jgi:hypothetical protein
VQARAPGRRSAVETVAESPAHVKPGHDGRDAKRFARGARRRANAFAHGAARDGAPSAIARDNSRMAALEELARRL